MSSHSSSFRGLSGGTFGRAISLAVALLIMLSGQGLFLGISPANAETAAPSIQSDQADYPPGGMVKLTGAHWQPGEAVHLYVNDDQGKTWERNSDVVADDTGSVADSFNLPDWFVATYKILATGDVSGTATAGFTDGNVKVDATAGVNARLTSTSYTGSGTCDNAGVVSTKDANAATLGVGNSDSLRLDAPAAGTSATGSRDFLNWTLTDDSTPRKPVQFTTIAGTGGRSICITGFANGSEFATANYADAVTVANTALSVASATGTYGGTAQLSATLKKSSGSSAISGKQVTFTLGDASVGTATTNASGVATLSSVSLAGINAGAYTNRVTADFAGDATFAAAHGSANLTVNQAPLRLTAADQSKTYGEANPSLTFSVTGLVNGDTKASALITDPTLTTAAASSGVGTYPNHGQRWHLDQLHTRAYERHADHQQGRTRRQGG